MDDNLAIMNPSAQLAPVHTLSHAGPPMLLTLLRAKARGGRCSGQPLAWNLLARKRTSCATMGT
eukprot:6200692-Pleurochrysis_carterae.AAC.1